jgi:hypothetical protein
MQARQALLLLVLLLIGCVHKYAVPGVVQSEARISSGAIVYVALAADGRDDSQQTYEGSGRSTQEAIANALTARGMNAILGESAADVYESIAAARAAGAGFLVYPEIVHWSDRATEWSRIPDRLRLSLVVHDVVAGEVRNQQELEASSRWLTLGGDHPQELLPGLTELWAESVTE